MATWEYLKKTASVDSGLYATAVRQEMEYEKTKADDKAAADKVKAQQARRIEGEDGRLRGEPWCLATWSHGHCWMR
jgi:hypothetical protein